MEIEVTKRSGIALFVAGLIIAFSVLGFAITPFSRAGEPLLLSPTNLAMLRYLRKSRSWLAELQSLDHQLSAILNNDTGNIYQLGKEAQVANQKASDLAQNISVEPVPPALAPLQEALQGAADNYNQAAQYVLLYIGAPEQDTRQRAYRSISIAQDAFRKAAKRQDTLWGIR